MSEKFNILAIESSGNPLSIGLLTSHRNHSDKFFLRRSSETNRSSEIIVPLISEVLSEACLLPQDLCAIAISQGPGSFTSLRVGMSVAKGLSLALDLPILALPTLSLFYRFSLELNTSKLDSSQYRLALQHSKADEFYFSLFHFGESTEALDSGYANAAEIGSIVNTIQKEKNCGCTILIRDDDLALKFFSSFETLVLKGFSAESMLLWAKKKFLIRDFSDTETLIPIYIKEFEARKSNKVVFLK